MAWISSKTSQMITTVAVSALYGASLIPQTFGLNKYRELMACYRQEKLQEMDKDLSELAEKVVYRSTMKPDGEPLLQLFLTSSWDPLYRGSLKVRSGAIVGIPLTYSYNTVDDIDRSMIYLQGSKVDWESKDGKALAESLVLSYKAKAFGIAREISYADTWHFHVEAFFRAATLMTAYTMCYSLNRSVELQSKVKAWARAGIYGAITFSCFLVYLSVRDTYYCRRDIVIDRKTAALGPAYAEGGVEYYEKLLQRNKAIRSLSGDVGKKSFTLHGNRVAVWHDPNVKLTTRRDNLVKLFESSLKEYESKDKDATVS